MHKFCRNTLLTAGILSMLANVGFAASDSNVQSNTIAASDQQNLNTIGKYGEVFLSPSDTSVFKPASLKSMDSYDQYYRLYKYDTISLRIIGFENAEGFSNIMVGPDGYVNLPYAGSVKLAGLTLEEAKQVLMQKMGRYIKIPDMSVMVTSYGNRKVQVLGEVSKPGTVELQSDDMNVLNAITGAGWVTTYGRIKKVQVIRIIDGTMYIKEANIKNYIKKHDIAQNFALEDGDILYIPKSNKIDFHQDILPFISVYSTYRALTD